MAVLQTQPATLSDALAVGLVVGGGYGVVTAVNAVSPSMPRPALYVLVTGSCHVCDLVLSAATCAA